MLKSTVTTAGELASQLRSMQPQLEADAKTQAKSGLPIAPGLVTNQAVTQSLEEALSFFDGLDPSVDAGLALREFEHQLGSESRKHLAASSARSLERNAGWGSYVAAGTTLATLKLVLPAAAFALAGTYAFGKARTTGAYLAVTDTVQNQAQALVHGEPAHLGQVGAQASA